MGGKRKRGAKDAPSNKKAKNGDQTAATSVPPQPKPSLDKAPFVELPTGDERRREAGLYELLSSEDESERIEAAICIISCLLDDEGVDEPVLQRHLDRRLFRGLASGRNAARLGYSLVITELLSQLFGEKNLAETKYTGLTFDKVLGFLMDKTQAAGNIPGQEERDHFFGQLFGLTSFVRSQTLFEPVSRWNTILDLLLKLGNTKVWLRSQCGWVIVQALEQMDKEKAEATLQSVADAGLAKTPEGVALWLVALDRFPDLKVKPWRHPLSSKSLGDLTAVLKESFQNHGADQADERKANKQANWTAQLHFVWDIILTHYAKGDVSASDFDQFWSRVVDDGLFSRNATDGQKFKGFMVFQTMLAGLADQQDKLECLFSKNFITCLMNQAAKEDRFLHRAATKALKVLESTVASQPASLSVVLKCLLGKNGAYNFDQRTNTKTVDRLLQNINSENEKGCLDIIQRPIAKLKQQEKADAQSTLRTYVDYLSKALNATGSSDPSKGEEVKGGSFGLALQELAHLAYSQPKNVPSELLTESIRNLCRSRLETSFAKLIRRSADFSVFCKAVSAIDSNAVTMDDDIKAAVEDALVRMDKLLKRKSKTDVEESLAQGLAILHAVSIFQLYNEEPDAMEVLQDLAQFSDRLKKGKLKEEGSGSSELLVEILLSMVVQPSSLMREVAQQVFDAFTSQISAEGLELLTGPLASGESTKGQQELFNTEDDAMDVDEDGSSDDEDAGDVEDASDVEIDSDVEFVTLNGAEADDGGSDEDEDGEEEEEDDDDDDEDDEEQQKLADLDDQLGKILNSHRLDKDADAESSDNDEDMSDSEMFALDDKLGEAIKHAVKSRNDTKKQKKDAKQSVVNFKHRILDLLDIYIKNEPLNPLSISLLVPLLRLMRTTSTKPLASRACGVILNHQKNLKKARSNKEEVKLSTVEDLLPSLMEIHEEASKDYSHAYAKAASAASLIVVSFMFAVDRSAIKQVAAVYAKTWSEWVLNEAKVQSSFFLDWYNWSQNQASQPVP